MRIPRDQRPAVGQRFIDLEAEITAAILLTIRAGWQILSRRQEVQANWLEVPITERLRGAMREALRELAWGKSMIVLPGTESRSHPSLTTPDGRTDIPLLLIELFVGQEEHDPHAIIECKRVAEGNAYLCRQYVKEGVDRFQNGQYASNHRTGFMTGYVISGGETGVVSSINRYLSDNARTSEHLQPSKILEEGWGWQSLHTRQAQSVPIELHHAFLSFVVPSVPQACP